MDTTEAAVERAPNAGMMHSSTLSKEGGPQILFNRKPMERRPGKLVGALHWALRIGAMKAEAILIAKPKNRIQRPLSS
jgi:hypothetical protein